MNSQFSIPFSFGFSLAAFTVYPNWIKLQKVPLMIHFPDVTIKGVNHINSGEMDIYPTVANLYLINI